MSIDLTDADLSALVECATQYGLAQALHAAHRAGLAAGRARAIEEAATVAERSAVEWNGGKQRQHIVAVHCAAAIRAMK